MVPPEMPGIGVHWGGGTRRRSSPSPTGKNQLQGKPPPLGYVSEARGRDSLPGRARGGQQSGRPEVGRVTGPDAKGGGESARGGEGGRDVRGEERVADVPRGGQQPVDQGPVGGTGPGHGVGYSLPFRSKKKNRGDEARLAGMQLSPAPSSWFVQSSCLGRR